jgi:hypothetical protein
LEEKISLKSKILELNNESSDIYMTLNVCILSNQTNLNNVRFTDDFIKGVVINKSEYIGIPLVVNRKNLENGLYHKLSHEYDRRTGELRTDIIGSFVDFWEKESDDGALLLIGSARVPKRFPNVCKALIELYENGELETSCEVLVSEYENIEDGVRIISYRGGKLFGDCIVDSPAEVRAKAELLIAEAIDKDLKGGEQVNQDKYNKGIEIEVFADIEAFSLSFDEITGQVYNLLNPVDSKGNRTYKYCILKFFNDFVIVEDWYNYDVLYKIPYKVEGESVVLSPENEWVKGRRGFIPDSADEVSIALNADKNKGEKIEIDNSKDAADMTGSWGSVNKSKLRKQLTSASNAETLVKEAYLIVEDGWEDAPSEHLKYPHHVIKNGVLVVSKDGVQTALSFLMRNDPENQDALNHLKRHYNELGLEWPEETSGNNNNNKEDKAMNEQEIKELKEKLEAFEKENKELKEKVEKLEKELNDSKAMVVSQQEEILQLKEEKQAVLSENEELKKFKETVEAEKKEAQKKELAERYKKLLPKEIYESNEVKQAIEDCDVNKLNNFVVSQIEKQTQTNKKDEILTFASASSDFVPVNKKDYLLAEVEE